VGVTHAIGYAVDMVTYGERLDFLCLP